MKIASPIALRKVARESNDLTRQSITLTHRPKLIVRNLRFDSSLSPKSFAEGTYCVINVGATKAVIAVAQAVFGLFWRAPDKAPYDELEPEKVSFTLEPGAGTQLNFRKIKPLEGGDILTIQ
jgi:hypothetical protein